MAQHTALVVGSTGIVGSNLAAHLVNQHWRVAGLARKPLTSGKVEPVAADLLDISSLEAALKDLRPTHLFLTTWMRQSTEAENIRVNSTMVRNILSMIGKKKSLKHVALVTGLKHYLGSFESYGKGAMPATPFREEQGRLAIPNFYYAQEDELFAAAEREGFTWSVHRPHTIIGYALGNAMNMGVTLAVYASLSKSSGLPFRFPGSSAQWNGLTDMTDARLLAKHLEWASTEPSAANKAFNVVNGDVFRWSWMWNEIAKWFNISPANFDGVIKPLEQIMVGKEKAWSELALRNGLIEPNIDRLISAWHTDADLGRPIEVIADMTLSRQLGFKDYQSTRESFFDLFAELRKLRVIPGE